jgi:hypothetical protein
MENSKAGIRVHGLASANAVFKTCCAMYNWLLEVDGLNDEWEQDKSRMWHGGLGNFARKMATLCSRH